MSSMNKSRKADSHLEMISQNVFPVCFFQRDFYLILFWYRYKIPQFWNIPNAVVADIRSGKDLRRLNTVF